MNYLLIMVGVALFIWGDMQNKKAKKNFKVVYDDVIRNQLEEKQISSEDKKYNVIEEMKARVNPTLIMGIGIGIILANFIFIAYQGLGYKDYEIEKKARKLGMKYEDEILVRYK